MHKTIEFNFSPGDIVKTKNGKIGKISLCAINSANTIVYQLNLKEWHYEKDIESYRKKEEMADKFNAMIKNENIGWHDIIEMMDRNGFAVIENGQ